MGLSFLICRTKSSGGLQGLKYSFLEDHTSRMRSGSVFPGVRITLARGDIIRYLCGWLDEDTTPDAMDSSLEADILKKIPEDVSKMYI